jgi:hypothetical protein
MGEAGATLVGLAFLFGLLLALIRTFDHYSSPEAKSKPPKDDEVDWKDIT